MSNRITEEKRANSIVTAFDIPALPDVPNFDVDIRHHGAAEGGQILNTAAIASAIKLCEQNGGGRVIVPAGVWLTGPIHLRSRINLHLEDDAELRFSQRPEDYLPVVFQQRGGIRCYNYSPFIYANACTDIAITGKGTLNGQGAPWWPWKHAQPGMVDLFQANRDRIPVEERVYGTREAGVRPPFFQAINCSDVLIEGVTFVNSPSWTVHPVWCENLTIRGITVKNPADAHNTDGIDPDGCRNVLIEDCLVDTGDDGICIKSGREYDGWEAGRPCENIIVRRCRVLSGHGGIVIGSEMAAGVRNMHVYDCEFEGSDTGVRVKTRAGRGGYIKDIQIERIRMRNILGEAIIISMRYTGEKLESEKVELADVPALANFLIRDIECESAGRSVCLEGLPGYPIRNVVLENIKIASDSEPVIDSVEELHTRDLVIKFNA